MSLPVFFPPPDISLRLPRGASTTLLDLCREAGIDCRATGLMAARPLFVGASEKMRAVKMPGHLRGVWLGLPDKKPKRRALLALGLLAYAVFDHGARESLRGLEVARATAGPGRPRRRAPLSAAERQRRRRAKTSIIEREP